MVKKCSNAWLYIPWELFSCSYRTHTHWDSSQPKNINGNVNKRLFNFLILLLCCYMLLYLLLVVNSPKKDVTVTYYTESDPAVWARGDCHFLLLPIILYTTQYTIFTDVLTELWIIWLATNLFLQCFQELFSSEKICE